jgi:hypothetical protein
MDQVPEGRLGEKRVLAQVRARTMETRVEPRRELERPPRPRDEEGALQPVEGGRGHAAA